MPPMHGYCLPLIGLFVVADGTELGASGRLNAVIHTRLGANGDTFAVRSLPTRSGSKNADLVLLRVRNVRLEPAPPMKTSPSATLKFDLFNEGSESLTDIVLAVSILETPHMHAPRTVLAGPYTIRGKNVLRPGHTMNYEMRLRNLSSACGCVASVDVTSVRSLIQADHLGEHCPLSLENGPPAWLRSCRS